MYPFFKRLISSRYILRGFSPDSPLRGGSCHKIMVMAWQWPFLGGQQYLWDIEWRNVYYKFIKILFINENTWNSTVMPWVTILHSSSTLLLLKLTFLKRVAGLIRWRLALKIHDHLARSVGSQANHLLHFLIVVLNKYDDQSFQLLHRGNKRMWLLLVRQVKKTTAVDESSM